MMIKIPFLTKFLKALSLLFAFSFSLVTLLVLLTTAGYGQQDRKEWSINEPLVWTDFKATSAPVGADPRTRGNTFAGIPYRYKRIGKDSSVYVFKFQVKSVMIRSKSWADNGYRTPYMLSHEQLHFDLTEYFARKLRDAFEAYSYTADYKQEIDGIKTPLLRQWHEMENTYDQQTDHGLKKKMQRKWAEYVAELLARDYPLETALQTEPVP